MSARRGAALALVAVVLGGCASAGASSLPSSSSTSGTTSTPGDVSSEQATTAGPAVPVVVADPHPQLPVTVTDENGDAVTVRDVSRIVSLAGGISETLFALGLGANVIGRDVSTEFPGTDAITLVTNGHDVSAEGVLSLSPTLVLADTRTGPPEAIDAIRAAGVPVVIVPEVWSLEEASARNDAIAAAVGLADAGAVLTDDLARHAAKARLDGSPVVAFLYLRGNAAVYLMGGDGSGADSLIEALGGIDAGSRAGLGAFTPLTPESLAATQPDAILVMEKGLTSVGGIDGLLALPGIAQTPAGEHARVISIPDGQLLSFGPRTPQTLDAIASQLRAAMAGTSQ